MHVQISKWGNSTAVRLPKHVAGALGLTHGREVDLVAEGAPIAEHSLVDQVKSTGGASCPRRSGRLENVVSPMFWGDWPRFSGSSRRLTK